MANSTTPTPSAEIVVLWGAALGLLVTSLTAPVRPWGWTGGGTLGFALMTAAVAFRATNGFPPRQLLVKVVGTALVLALLIRVILPSLLGLMDA